MRRLLPVIAGLVILLLGVFFASHVQLHPRVVTIAPAEITREPLRPGHTTLLFLGDTGLGDAAQSLLDADGYDAPLRPTVDLVQSADVAIANLEMPITDRRVGLSMWKEWRYRSDPRAAAALASAGLDIVELANNHSTDQGAAGLDDTIARVRAAGMEPVGGGDEPSARRGLVVRVGDVRVGLLDYCERQYWWELVDDQFARGTRVGAAMLTDAALTADIARLRPLVDLVVVSLHIGYNYAPPTKDTLRWSQRAISLGADLVVNHHPHVAHPLAVHDGHLIALSLGNWAFGTPGHDELSFGEMLFVELEGKRVQRAEIVPIDVQNERVQFRPRPLVGKELDATLASLVHDSAAYGATLERVDDRVVWRAPTTTTTRQP